MHKPSSAITLLCLHLRRKALAKLSVIAVLCCLLGAGWYRLTHPAERPLAFSEIYITDYPAYFSERMQFSLTNGDREVCTALITKYFVYEANAYFISVFIPKMDNLFNAIASLPNQMATILSALARIQTSTWIPGDSSATHDKDMVFGGRVFIYYEGELDPQQIGVLFSTFRDKKLSIEFRGEEYYTHHWEEFYRRNAPALAAFKKEYPTLVRCGG